MKLIDLSVTIESMAPVDPPGLEAVIDYSDHENGYKQMLQFFPTITKEELASGKGWAIETATMSTHIGTHLDAPYHYAPTMNKGERAITIDEVPLEWCYSDGVMLDFSDKDDGYLITVQDLIEALEKINYTLKPFDIVLIHTNAQRNWNKRSYLGSGAGFSKDSTLWLCKQGVKVTGTDAWSWDRPLSFLASEYAQNKDGSIIWEAHFAGLEIGYCHLEKLNNLELLPPYGFKVMCFPVKIKDASAGWTRAVALVEN